jgi:UDP-N-acetylglucosamine 4-epimerase
LTPAAIKIKGDGYYNQGFTYVTSAVQTNILALFTDNPNAVNQIYNIACGDRTTLKELWEYIKEITGSAVDVIHRENRVGDIPHSLADISKAKTVLNYNPSIKIKEGLEKSLLFYRANEHV